MQKLSSKTIAKRAAEAEAAKSRDEKLREVFKGFPKSPLHPDSQMSRQEVEDLKQEWRAWEESLTTEQFRALSSGRNRWLMGHIV